MKYHVLFLFIPFVIVSCKSTENFTGFSYDPPNVTDTSGRDIEFQKKRVIGAGNPKVWVSNEFEGARMNDFYAKNDSTFEVFISPENAPINNSPWYAFKIWSDAPQIINLRLNYDNARHRYTPKLELSNDGITSKTQLDSIFVDSLGVATFQIQVNENPKTISAQFLSLISDFPKWESEMLSKPFIAKKIAGYSNLGNPISQLTIDETSVEQKGVLAILGRQHPPETTGFLASLYFVEALTDSSELAQEFRDHFIVEVFPIINPDGVKNGHWRHNARGIDLNRDWENFNQPETRVVRDALSPMLNEKNKQLYYALDFHSTNENIFYPINEEVKTFPDNLSQRWYEIVVADNPDIKIVSEEFDTSSPIAKNWFFKTFGSDALTFEVDDAMTNEQIKNYAQSSAKSLMQLLINEWKLENF